MKKRGGGDVKPRGRGQAQASCAWRYIGLKALGRLVQAKWREQEAGVSKVWQRAGGTGWSRKGEYKNDCQNEEG